MLNKNSAKPVPYSVYNQKVNCRICKTDNLDLLHDFGMMPVAGYLVDSMQKALTEKKYPSFLVRCPNCGLVQQGVEDFLTDLVDKVYSNYQPTYSMSSEVREYMSRFIDDAIQSSAVKKGDIVLEIGSNDGSMLDILNMKGVVPAGIDPSAIATASEKDVIVVRDFFSAPVAKDFVNKHGKVKLLFSRHTLEHAFDPADFMNSVSLVLHDQGVAVIEVPYLPSQLNGNQYAGMSFQHISFFTLESLKCLGELHGLHVFNVKPSRMDGGSIVVYLAKNARATTSLAHLGFLELEKASGMTCLEGLLNKFESVGASMKRAREHIIGLHENSLRIIGYGAGSKGQAILNMLGLSSDIIPNVVDDTPNSKGMYIPGASTRVVDSSDAYFSEADIVMVTAPTHVDEIVAKEQNRHPKAAFIRTSPDFNYVSNL